MSSRPPHTRFFPYRSDLRLAPLWLLFRAWPGNQGVTVTPDLVCIRYAPLHFDAPVHQIADAHITGPYRWWKSVGPRLSFVDDGLTFGTNADAGVCIHFQPRIRRVLGLWDHSAVTVTVADPEALLAALGRQAH